MDPVELSTGSDWIFFGSTKFYLVKVKIDMINLICIMILPIVLIFIIRWQKM